MKNEVVILIVIKLLIFLLFYLQIVNQVNEQRVVMLSNKTIGTLYPFNHPQRMPPNVELVQHFIAPLGEIISVELHGVQFVDDDCVDNSTLEVISTATAR